MATAPAKQLFVKAVEALRAAISPERLLRVLIWVYYIPLWLWGIYGTFFAAPATYVLPVMGQFVYDLWIWMHMIGPPMVMCGMYFDTKAAAFRRVGVRLQAGGHLSMFYVLLAYELAAVYATAWGQGTYSIFVISPYVTGAVLLSMQAMFRISESNRDEDKL